MGADRLEISWDGKRVGFLTPSPKKGRSGVLFEYAQSWLDTVNMPISLSMPCSALRFDAQTSTNYFANFLPEGDMYGRLCEKFRIREGDVYAFLRIFGEECAGALTITSPGAPLSALRHAYKDITDDLPRLLRQASGFRTGIILESGARLSIAGAQDKLPVYTDNGRFLIPEPGSFTPTTDILKPVPSGFPDLDRNEDFCLRLADRIGLPASKSSLVTFDDQRALLVERYDRIRTPGGVQRVHQEDFCQALGYSNRRKYESDGGPGFAACGNVLLSPVVLSAASARDNFIICAVYNYIIGNCDAHGKNFSLMYSSGERRAFLAPFYDMVSTRAYPGLDQKYAMAVGQTWRFDRISGHSWREFAAHMHIATEKLQTMMLVTACQIAAHANELASEREAACGSSPVYEKILSVIGEGNERIEKAAESLRVPANSIKNAEDDDADNGPQP